MTLQVHQVGNGFEALAGLTERGHPEDDFLLNAVRFQLAAHQPAMLLDQDGQIVLLRLPDMPCSGIGDTVRDAQPCPVAVL